MAYTIATVFLTRTVTVKRPKTSADANADGLVPAPDTISAAAKVRIYSNEDYGRQTGEIESQGIVSASSHKGIASATEDIKAGDTITDNATSEDFKVNLVDSQPAGHSGHHIELWLSSSEFV